MFIRTKMIKGKKYAYLVENNWTQKGSRQKTVEYLGKICELEKTKTILFEEFITKMYNKSIEEYFNNTAKTIIYDLICCELEKHGFSNTLSKNVFITNNIVADITKPKFFKNNTSEAGMDVVLRINNEYLCPYTIKRLLNLRIEGDEQFCGKQLAEAIVAVGIVTEPDIFILLFEKLYKDEKLVISG
ncbi:hypothetical protein HZA96_04780 [Candidatus Woesearchaeota archaeon]|nr:hypothetical protein [Candidatus Woesearchaeota archaeon]